MQTRPGWTGNAQFAADLRLSAPAQNPDAAALALLQRNLALASDPMVAMVGTFVWNTFHECDFTIYGARGLPQVRAYLEHEGRLLLNRSAVPGSLPPVIEFVASPLAPSASESIGTGSIWTWATSHATRCRSITEEASGTLQDMPPNGVVYRPLSAAQTPDYEIECTGPGVTRRKSLKPMVP